MSERIKKPKFKPVVTRVKLNPEQAVLQCSCYSVGLQRTDDGTTVDACIANTKVYSAAPSHTTGSVAAS